MSGNTVVACSASLAFIWYFRSKPIKSLDCFNPCVIFNPFRKSLALITKVFVCILTCQIQILCTTVQCAFLSCFASAGSHDDEKFESAFVPYAHQNVHVRSTHSCLRARFPLKRARFYFFPPAQSPPPKFRLLTATVGFRTLKGESVNKGFEVWLNLQLIENIVNFT